jgi:hypothetical protein
MDAALFAAGLIEEFNVLLDQSDFDGAEGILALGYERQPELAAFFHFHSAQLYKRWNKLTSAIHHLIKAAELSKAKGDELFLIQILEELKRVRRLQAEQQP